MPSLLPGPHPALDAAFPSLTPIERAGRLSPAALAAKNLRTLLRERWPQLVFKVHPIRYTGGSSLHVVWHPPLAGQPPLPEEEFNRVLNQFQRGETDWRDDGYYNVPERQPFIDRFGGVRHVLSMRRDRPEERADHHQAQLNAVLPASSGASSGQRKPRL